MCSLINSPFTFQPANFFIHSHFTRQSLTYTLTALVTLRDAPGFAKVFWVFLEPYGRHAELPLAKVHVQLAIARSFKKAIHGISYLVLRS